MTFGTHLYPGRIVSLVMTGNTFNTRFFMQVVGHFHIQQLSFFFTCNFSNSDNVGRTGIDRGGSFFTANAAEKYHQDTQTGKYNFTLHPFTSLKTVYIIPHTSGYNKNRKWEKTREDNNVPIQRTTMKLQRGSIIYEDGIFVNRISTYSIY